MRSFAYERPASLAEATRILAEAGESARVLAGGTDLVVGLRDDSIQPDVVVDLKWVEEFGGESVVRADGRSVQIRNRATLAGNICNGSPAADTAPPQLLYGAVVVIAGPDGERRLSIDEFMLGARRPGPDKRKVDLRPGELVAAIEIPVPPPDFSAPTPAWCAARAPTSLRSPWASRSMAPG